jgi:fructose-1,6-bisphosphatase I
MKIKNKSVSLFKQGFIFELLNANGPNEGLATSRGNAMAFHAKIGLALNDFLLQSLAPDVARVVEAIAAATIPVAAMIRRGALAGALGQDIGDANADGDAQKLLDVLADQHFAATLRAAGIRALASEEHDQPQILNPEGGFLVAIDPLDGSSNIDTNVSIGTIFSVLDAPSGEGVTAADFLRPGHEQRAAGFVIYGPQTILVFTVGEGTHMCTLDPETSTFVITKVNVTIPEGSPEFAINASNYRHWHPPVQAYIDDCIEGADGPRARNFNMRWIASLVADAFRILVRGGVFLYPSDNRKGYERGRLRHVYEASPIAFLVEQAGGAATDGVNRILDSTPQSLHGRIPFIFGAVEKVDRIRRYHLDGDTLQDQSPLFGKRGLLRR